MDQAGPAPRIANRTCQGARIDVMPADVSRLRIVRSLARRKQELPTQLLRSPRILPRQRIGQGDAGHTSAHITLVQVAPPGKLPLQLSPK